MTDQFSTYDAAYLLGALTPAGRSAYEAHLAECQDCRRGVTQLAGMPGLLAGLAPDQARSAGEVAPAVPETLLPRLLAEVQRTRFRRRMATGLVGVAAATVLAIALVVGLRGASPAGDSTDTVNLSAGQQMTPVSASVPISATALLDDKAWGTRIVVRCVYLAPPSQYQGTLTYTMVVTDRSGGTQQIAAWVAKPGAPIVVDGSTSVPHSQIASVQVRDPENEPILTLQL
ncbi:MAG: anti-sigma factor [Actinomycetota bacterium]|nr:anti-sigma factor [Actinomycetota bacterium]